MTKLACPHCYHRIDGDRLWFQCTGRAGPGRTACTPVLDEDRQRETNFNDATMPSFRSTRKVLVPRLEHCPQCGSQSGIRVCPCCHTPLSANFGGSKSPLIAMVGAKGTGKTIYLSVLAHELRNGLRRRFGADVRMTTRPRDIDIDKVYRERALFAQTASSTDGRSEPILFEWRQERRIAGVPSGHQTTYLSFYDTAGEDLNTQQKVHDLTYIGAADALILLLDPFAIPKARDLIKLPDSAVRSSEAAIDVLNHVTDALRVAHGISPSRNIKVPLAVAFAKMDAFYDVLGPDHPLVRAPLPSGVYDEAMGQTTHEYVRAMLYEWGADDIDAHLRFNYTNFRYFAVSSLGAEPDYDVDVNAAVSDRGIQPYRVDEPLVWLLSKFDVVPKADRR